MKTIDELSRSESSSQKESRLSVDLKAFQDFVRENHDLFDGFSESDILSGQIADVIYSRFYRFSSGGVDSHNEHFEKLLEEYRQKIASVYEWAHRKEGITADSNGYWLMCTVGRFYFHSPIGRIYLNPRIQDAPELFRETIDQLADRNISAKLKIPEGRDISSLKRSDKMVVYFNSPFEAEVVSLIDKIYSSHSKWFDEDTPRFSMQLNDSDGHKMRGISFGQEPDKEKVRSGDSFGGIRSKILAGVFIRARGKNKKVWDADFDIMGAYKQECQLYGVDWQQPAINNDGRDLFPEIIMRESK